MRPPGLLSPDDFPNLTDEELDQVKRESGTPGSHYWDWATTEQQRRDRIRQEKALALQEQQLQLASKKKKWKFADIPHPIQIILMLIAIGIAGYGLWFNVWRIKPTVAPGREQLGNLLADGIKLTDECGYMPAHPPMPPDLATRVIKWHDDVLRTLTTQVNGEYVKQWQDTTLLTSPEAGNSNGAQCALVKLKSDALRDILTKAFK